MKQLLLSTAIAFGTISMAQAQTAPVEDLRPSGAEAFTPGNAILNTAILFAVGAREAQQSLRNAFGWPTFQEGLVQGVYFRFDPDGYARFSPSPRLDADVFEVICRPRTFTCIARKGPLALVLNTDGRVQLGMDQVQATDTFALNDGFSELQVPPRVIGVLEPQMETLLSSGGSLIVRRNGDVLEDVSLAGFSAVVSYLKWVAARQDYSVLPRDWPVPNGVAPDPNLTSQVSNWPNSALRSQPVLGATQAPAAAEPASNETPEMAALRSEVALLRDLLLAQGGQVAMPAAAAPAMATTEPAMEGHSEQDEILRQLEALRTDMGVGAMTDSHSSDLMHGATGEMHDDMMKTTHAGMEGHNLPDSPAAEVRHLHYLTVEMGFPARTALLILQMSSSGDGMEAEMWQPAMSPSDDLLQQLVSETEATPMAEPVVAAPDPEYELLGTYFRSVITK